MSTGGGSVPAIPAMSAEEKDFLRKQGLTLDKFNNILSESQIGLKENQDILKNLSGLYDSTTTVGTPAREDFAIDNGIVSKQRKFLSDLGSLISPGKQNISDAMTTKLKQNGFTDDVINKLAEYDKANPGVNLGKFDSFYDSLVEAAKEDTSGLGQKYGIASKTTIAATPDKTELTLNKDKLSSLRKRIDDYQTKQDEISRLQTDRYEKALRGELPISEGTVQRKAKDYSLLLENLSRRGNKVAGATPESAVSSSTAGNESLGEFNRTYALVQDAERRGELATGGVGASPGGMSLSYLSGAAGYSPSSLLPGYTSLSNNYGGAAQPYANQRGLQYQATLQNAQLQNQGAGALYGLLGTAVGAYFGGPWGAAAGGAVGSKLGSNYA